MRSATPLLVNKRDLTLELPANLKTGDTLKMNVDRSSDDNLSVVYAAIMIRCRIVLAADSPADVECTLSLETIEVIR